MATKNINRFYPLFYLSLLLCSVFHRMYYRRFEVEGKSNIPLDRPVIFATCHQNALMDALAVIFATKQQIVFLARSDIFRKKFTAALLRFIRILPVYRIRDGYHSLEQNQETFDEVNQVLNKKIPIGIFPEGLHLGKKMLKPLRKGIARMAFQAEMKADFKLGLQILPVGLDYSDYHHAGSDLLVNFGKPLNVADYKEKYFENPAIAMNSLLEDLAAGMLEVMIDIRPDKEYDKILMISERCAQAEIKKQELTNTLQNKFIQQKRAAKALSEAYFHNQLEYNDLCNEMTSRLKNQKQMSSRCKSFKSIAQIFLLVTISPIFLYGALINFIPLLITLWNTRNIKDPHFVSSFRFGLGFVIFNLWYLILTIAIFLIFSNVMMALGVILLLPVTGIFAFYYARSVKSFLKQAFQCSS